MRFHLDLSIRKQTLQHTHIRIRFLLSLSISLSLSRVRSTHGRRVVIAKLVFFPPDHESGCGGGGGGFNLFCATDEKKTTSIYNIIMYRFPRALYHRWVVGRRSSSGIRAEIHQWYSVAAADYDVFVPLEEENGSAVRHHLPSCPGVVSCHTTFSRSFISRPAAAPNAICATITPSHRHCTVTDDHHHRHRLRLCH